MALSDETRSTLDFLTRIAFFAAAPFLLVFVAALFPVTGALVQIALTLGVFFAEETVKRLATRSKIIKLIVSSMLDFEAYYREHRPRPFLYYVFYPLLFPYWLLVPAARQEFLLFKGYTLASFILLVAGLVYGYFSSFPPDLGLKDFALIAAGTFVAETVVVLMFLMPIVTTVVHFHTVHAPRRLIALLVVGAVSIAFAIVRVERPRDPVVSWATRARVRMRAAAKPSAALDAETRALREAWKALPRQKDDVDHDGKVLDLPLDKAHTALSTFFHADEAYAFDLWYQKKGKTATMVVYFESRGGKPPIWLAMGLNGIPTHDVKNLPRGAFIAMKHAADAAE